ncbi:MAG: diaminopimelate epimerase [Opitutus sp.]|nr:diaminopimelate epimerase [Opitutus sp.]
MRFQKYHALGNDYLVLDPADSPASASPEPAQVRALCDRHRGVGSDGILWGPLPSATAGFRLRIFNPDGSEAEKSGNGLRIFARYLFDRGKVSAAPFTIETAGGTVEARVLDAGRSVTVDMGRVSFTSTAIPVAGPARDVLDEVLEAGGRQFTFCAATVGNPHCVVPLPEISPALAHEFGPLIERHALFPNRTNVQFLRVLDRANIQIEIWERGAGYTLASGSSSCAAAAVACRLGRVDRDVTVHMPGGRIRIELGIDWTVRMTGAVTRVAEVRLDSGFFGRET